MTHREIKYIETFLIAAFIAVGAILIMHQLDDYYRSRLYTITENTIVRHKDAPPTITDTSVWRQYQNGTLGIAFKYPREILVNTSATSGVITLNHNIPFENHGTCDMKGDEATYETLDDFSATIQIEKGSVAKVVKKLSPYIPAENFSGQTLKINPGFTDEVQIGDYKGFSIYEGAEGCGWTIYYFPIDDSRVLVVKKDMVQQLSSAVSPDIKNQILKVPGVIAPEQSNAIFNQIIESLKTKGSTAGWKTYKNEKYGFGFQYPESWTYSHSTTTGAIFFDCSKPANSDTSSEDWYYYCVGPISISIFDPTLNKQEFLAEQAVTEKDNKKVLVHTVRYGDNDVYTFTTDIGGSYIIFGTEHYVRINDEGSVLKGTDELNHILSTFKFTK